MAASKDKTINIPSATRRTVGLGISALRAPGRSTRWLLLLGAVALLWPVYVYGSSQVAWLVATSLLAALAFDLSTARSPLLAGLLLGVVALLGTEANGDLAAGHAPLGTLRTLDLVVLAALVPRLLELRPRAKMWWTSTPTLLILVLLAYATVLWAVHGQPVDSLVRADVRLTGLVLATWLAVRELRPWDVRWVARGTAILVLLVAAKAAALYVSGYWTIGTYDRVQAATVQPAGESLRLILVGGDSLMIVAPACLVALAYGVGRRTDVWLLAAAGGAALVGLLISGTRSSLLIALLLLGAVAAFAALHRGGRTQSWRGAAAIVVAGGLLVLGASAMGVTGRLVQQDAPGTGLDFRRQEIRSFLELPPQRIAFGQGFGGRYEGRSVLGGAVAAGWSHAFPVFIALKVGLFGLLVIVGLLAVLAQRTVRAYARHEAGDDRALLLCGASAIIGVLVMSLTLGRVALPEGAIVLVLGLTLLSSVQTSRP